MLDALTGVLMMATIACLVKPIGELSVILKLAIDGQYVDAMRCVVPNLLLCAVGSLTLFLSRSCYITKNWLMYELARMEMGT